MDYQRTFLIAALIIVGFLLWSAWQKDHAQYLAKHAQQTITAQATKKTGRVTQTPTEIVSSATTPMPASLDSAKLKKGETITVETGTLNLTIDTLGGNIIGASLPKYPAKIKQPDGPFKLLSTDPDKFYIAQSALVGNGNKIVKDRQFKAEQKTYTLADGQKQLQVKLTWSDNNLRINKTFTFSRDSYLVNVRYQIINNTDKTWTGHYTMQLTRKATDKAGGLFHIHTYMGAAISSPEHRYQELSFKDLAKTPISQTITNGWAAMVERYFLGAWIPDPDQSYSYFSKSLTNNVFAIGMTSPKITIAPGQSGQISSKLYLGPEIASILRPIAPGLELTISYGWLWMISVVLFKILKFIHDVVGNWGWAIVLLTLLIKLVFYPLSAKSFKSMAKMRKLQPKIKTLQERFKEDKQKLSQAMMQLYKKEKVNPLSGCLPIIIQIPVFFALYMVLIESVQLRQAPWILWIHDLSVPDPYYILPILMGLTMFVQQKLSPPPPDPTQAKVMLFLPVVFTVLFVHFPAGLVLYWTVNNALQSAQQWWVYRRVDN